MQQNNGMVWRGRELRPRRKPIARRLATVAAIALLAAVAGGWALITAERSEAFIRDAVSDAFSAGAKTVGKRGRAKATVQPAQALSTSEPLPLLESFATLHTELVELSSALDASTRNDLADRSPVSVCASVANETDYSHSRSIETSVKCRWPGEEH